jgi:hypothetical protein
VTIVLVATYKMKLTDSTETFLGVEQRDFQQNFQDALTNSPAGIYFKSD